MKNRIIYFVSVIAIAFAISCSQQIEPTTQFAKSTATFAITPSTQTVAVASADSLNSAVSFTWNDPKYAVGLANTKFTIVVAPTGKNFANFATKSITNALTGSLLGNELNSIALKFGGVNGQPITLDMKVVASQTNNDEPLTSNVVQVVVTPYADLALTTISSTTVVTAPATYANVAAVLSWNRGFIGYEGTVTYQLQYAKGGTNFASPTVVSETTKSQSYTQGDLNAIAAVDYGVAIGSIGTIDFRIKATNGAATVVYSNVLTFSVTTSKIVPKYPVPANLYITGDATPGGWQAGGALPAGGVPVPSQVFTQIDDNTFGLILQLTGGKSYLLLPVNGDWGHKYNPSISGANPMGDAFAPDAGGNNIPAPANSGLYKIIVDFVHGTYSLTLLSTNPIPDNLYITGDATAGGWQTGGALPAGGVPVPGQQFTQITNGEFQLSIPLTGGNQYLFIPVNGDWGHKFNPPNAGENPLGDIFAPDAGGNNFAAPATSATYLIDVNFLTMTYKLTQ